MLLFLAKLHWWLVLFYRERITHVVATIATSNSPKLELRQQLIPKTAANVNYFNLQQSEGIIARNFAFLTNLFFLRFQKKGKFSIIGLNFAAEHIKAKLWDSFKERKFMDAASNMPPLWMGFAKTWWYLATKTASQKLYAPRYFQTTREQFWFRKKASLLNKAYHFDVLPVIQSLYDHHFVLLVCEYHAQKRGKSTERDVPSNGRGTISRWNDHLNV